MVSIYVLKGNTDPLSIYLRKFLESPASSKVCHHLRMFENNSTLSECDTFIHTFKRELFDPLQAVTRQGRDGVTTLSK
jgi:hypothetical protein